MKALHDLYRAWRNRPRPVALHELALFTQQLFVMFGAGVVLHRALLFYAQGNPGPLGEAVLAMSDKVADGERLSEAMSRYPSYFDRLYVGMIRTGEDSGSLHAMLEQLTELLVLRDRLQRKLTSSLVYPAFLLSVGVLSMLVFMLYILPNLGPLYKALGVPLPGITQVVVSIGNSMSHPAFWLALTTMALLARPTARAWLEAQPERRRQLDGALLRVPILGNYMQKSLVSRMLTTFAVLLRVGIAPARSLEMLADVVENREIRGRIYEACARLQEGKSIAASLRAARVVPEAAVYMVAVGEEVSMIPRMADGIARIYADEAELAAHTMAALLEPLILVSLALVSGAMMLALLLPIVSLLQRL